VTALTHPAYGLLRPVTDTASVLLCNNPGLMTLDGTNTWVLRGPGSDEMVVVDPGPDDDEHIARIAELGKIPLVLISHRHDDHTGGIDKIVDRTGAVVRSVGSGFLRGLGGPLTEGEVIDAAGLRITVMATPGHTADSVSFLLDDAVLTADTVLAGARRSSTTRTEISANTWSRFAACTASAVERCCRVTARTSTILKPSAPCT